MKCLLFQIWVKHFQNTGIYHNNLELREIYLKINTFNQLNKAQCKLVNISLKLKLVKTFL